MNYDRAVASNRPGGANMVRFNEGSSRPYGSPKRYMGGNQYRTPNQHQEYRTNRDTSEPQTNSGRTYANVSKRNIPVGVFAKAQLIGEGYIEQLPGRRTVSLYTPRMDDPRDSAMSDWGRRGVESDGFGQLLTPVTSEANRGLTTVMKETLMMSERNPEAHRFNIIRPEEGDGISVDMPTRDMINNPRKYLNDVLLHHNAYINYSELNHRNGGDYVDVYDTLVPEMVSTQQIDGFHQSVAEMQYDESVFSGRKTVY